VYLIIIISNYSFCSMDTRRFPFLIPKCEGCDLIAKKLLSCEAPCQYPLRLATRVLQVDACKWLPFWEVENEKHELVNGLGRPNLEQCHFGLRRIQFDLGLELRLWWPASQGCHHQFTATHWWLTKLIRQVQWSLQAVAKETLSDHWCSRQPLLIQRNQSSRWSLRTQHTTSCSDLWLLHPQFQHLVMRDTSLGRRRRRRMWRRGGDGNWGRGRWCICQWLRGWYLAWWWGNRHEHCTLDFIETFSLHYIIGQST